MSLYDEIGGEETFERLVHAFYEGVAADAELRALYPEADLGPAERAVEIGVGFGDFDLPAMRPASQARDQPAPRQGGQARHLNTAVQIGAGRQGDGEALEGGADLGP